MQTTAASNGAETHNIAQDKKRGLQNWTQEKQKKVKSWDQACNGIQEIVKAGKLKLENGWRCEVRIKKQFGGIENYQ